MTVLSMFLSCNCGSTWHGQGDGSNATLSRPFHITTNVNSHERENREANGGVPKLPKRLLLYYRLNVPFLHIILCKFHGLFT